MIKKLCRAISILTYKAMRFCEKASGDAKKIQKIQNEVVEKVQNSKNVKDELSFVQDNIISKEEHIERLYMFIEHVAINFRKENYNEVSKALKKINL